MNGSTQLQCYVPLPGGDMLTPGPDTYWHADWLGSVRLATAVSGRTVTYDRAFAPYGEMYNTVTGGSANPSFAGDAQDTVSGEYDTWYRQFHPTQGRWISPDPAGLAAVDPTNPQSWNRYAYVGNNPLMFVDPLGLEAGDCSDITYAESHAKCRNYPGCIAYGTEGCIPIPGGGDGGADSGMGGTGGGGGGGGGNPNPPSQPNPQTQPQPTPVSWPDETLGLPGRPEPISFSGT